MVSSYSKEPTGVAAPENGLYVGTVENFDEIIAEGVAFVKFFAPW
jgi:hypothetical protein